MYGYIYKTVNNVNGKIYIGQKKGKYNCNYFGSGKLIKQAFLKYGIESFTNEMIEQCETKEKLNEREKYWISKYNSFYNVGCGYNITSGGDFGDITIGMTNEQLISWKNNMSKSRIGNTNCLGNKLSNETKDKIRESRKHLTIEQRENISKAQSKHVIVIYKKEKYEFQSLKKTFNYFIKNFNMDFYYFLRYKKAKKGQEDLFKDVSFIKIDDKNREGMTFSI